MQRHPFLRQFECFAKHEQNVSKTSKKESRFYIAKTINETKEKIENKVKTYNEKYVRKQVENGREFITELKADPVKRIDDLIDIKKFRANNKIDYLAFE